METLIKNGLRAKHMRQEEIDDNNIAVEPHIAKSEALTQLLEREILPADRQPSVVSEDHTLSQATQDNNSVPADKLELKYPTFSDLEQILSNPRIIPEFKSSRKEKKRINALYKKLGELFKNRNFEYKIALLQAYKLLSQKLQEKYPDYTFYVLESALTKYETTLVSEINKFIRDVEILREVASTFFMTDLTHTGNDQKSEGADSQLVYDFKNEKYREQALQELECFLDRKEFTVDLTEEKFVTGPSEIQKVNVVDIATMTVSKDIRGELFNAVEQPFSDKYIDSKSCISALESYGMSKECAETIQDSREILSALQLIRLKDLDQIFKEVKKSSFFGPISKHPTLVAGFPFYMMIPEMLSYYTNISYLSLSKNLYSLLSLFIENPATITFGIMFGLISTSMLYSLIYISSNLAASATFKLCSGDEIKHSVNKLQPEFDALLKVKNMKTEIIQQLQTITEQKNRLLEGQKGITIRQQVVQAVQGLVEVKQQRQKDFERKLGDVQKDVEALSAQLEERFAIQSASTALNISQEPDDMKVSDRLAGQIAKLHKEIEQIGHELELQEFVDAEQQ